MKKLSISMAVLALALVGVTGCASPAPDAGSGSDTGDEGGRYGETDGGTPDATGISSLTTTESDFGTIVVDDQGMTVYVFDQDTQGSGASSCEGACLANWPPVVADPAPSLDGVTGEVATITGTDGSTQVTLNGWPLYYFAGDSAAGDTAGQGVNDVWWVIGPDGTKITG